MRIPSSVKLVVATWLAALVGALAGRSLAIGGAIPTSDDTARASVQGERTHANALVTKSVAAINRH